MSIIFVFLVAFIISAIFVSPSLIPGASLAYGQSSKVSTHQQLKIHFERSGGFAGRNSSIDIDTNALDATKQQNINTLVHDANFFKLPQDSPLPERGADYFKYKITIENEENKESHTIKTNDITMPSELRPLVKYLNEELKNKLKGNR